MKRFGLGCLLAAIVIPGAAQQSSGSAAPPSGQSVTQILTLMAQALGGPLPSDVEVTGTMQIEAGGRSETATLTAAARGTSETYEVISGQYTQTKLVFANGQAAENGATTSLELACTAQSAIIPATLVSELSSDPNTGGQVIGTESIDGVSLLHIRTWTNFSNTPDLAPFSDRDWWVDPATGLVHRLVFERRAAGGATPTVEYLYDFESFQSVSGVLMPSLISESVNGTSYARITISSVQANVGLTDQDFPVQ